MVVVYKGRCEGKWRRPREMPWAVSLVADEIDEILRGRTVAGTADPGVFDGT
jgi:hypothetical protein